MKHVSTVIALPTATVSRKSTEMIKIKTRLTRILMGAYNFLFLVDS